MSNSGLVHLYALLSLVFGPPDHPTFLPLQFLLWLKVRREASSFGSCACEGPSPSRLHPSFRQVGAQTPFPALSSTTEARLQGPQKEEPCSRAKDPQMDPQLLGTSAPDGEHGRPFPGLPSVAHGPVTAPRRLRSLRRRLSM